jgi:hypothetical protein
VVIGITWVVVGNLMGRWAGECPEEGLIGIGEEGWGIEFQE